MAIGITPKHLERYPLENLSAAHFLALGIEATTELGWKVASVIEAGFTAYTDNGLFSFNAEIQVKIEGAVVNLKSSSKGNGIIDWGRNRKLIDKLMDKIYELEPTFSPEHLDVKYKEIESEFARQ